MRRRIDIACGLVVQSQVVLDEPTTGLIPGAGKLICGQLLKALPMLLTTAFERWMCSVTASSLIDHGIIIAEGAPRMNSAPRRRHLREIVPRVDLKDLTLSALGSLPPEHHRRC